MADKIDQLTLNGTSYDIDLPPDATPSISGLTVSGNVSDGTTTKTMTELLAGDSNYYPTAVSWTNGGASGPTGTITMSGTSNISIPAIPGASASYSGIVTTGGQTFAGNKGFNGSVVLNNGGTFYKPIYLGTAMPGKGDGSTAYFGEDLIMNRRTGAVSGFYAESSQWNRFLGLHMNPAYICTCNYKGDGTATTATSTDGLWKASQSGDNTQWSGYLGYLFNSNFTNGATFPVANLSTNPIVITVKSTTGTRIDATDTDYVELNGWRYEGIQGTSNYYGKLTAYKLEILTDYENDTWVKTFERTNVEDNIYSIKFPVWSSVGGSESYTNFYGIRLTISGATAGGSGYLGLTEFKLMETRPAGAPADGVGAISQLGGNLYGNITLPSKSGAGKYTEIKISPSDSDNYNQLGESSKQWYRIYGKNIYRNGTEINSLYVPQTRTVNGKALSSDITLSASDVGALSSSTSYVSSVNGSTGAITNVAKTNADNNFSVSQTMAGADASSGTLKVNVLHAKTSSSSTTYGAGTSGQVLKSNGTNCYWGSDSSDTTSQGMGGNYKWKNPMAGYQIFITDRDNKLVPMVTGASGTASTGTSKTMNTQAFDPFGLIGYTSSSSYKAADALCSSSTWLATASLDLRYSFNCGSTLTTNAPVYIVAQVQSNGTAILSSPYYSQTLPSSVDGKIYIYLGQAISTTNLNLLNDHPIYQYVDGSLKQYTGSSSGGGGGLTLLYSGYCSDIDDSVGTEINNTGLYAITGYIDAGNMEEEMIGSSHMNDKLYIEVIGGGPNAMSSNIFPLTKDYGYFRFYGIWDATIEDAIQGGHDEINIYKLG